MGFWEQMNNNSVDRRRSRNYSACDWNTEKETMNASSNEDFSEQEMMMEASGDEELSEQELSFESLLSEWDLRDLDSEHPEWIQDPELQRGIALVQLMDFSAIECFGNAAARGNILAIAAMGDFLYRVFEFYTQGKHYRYGMNSFADGLIKGSIMIYVLAMLHEPYTEKMEERLMVLRETFTHESKFMSILEEAGEKVSTLSFEHPEELMKIFSLQ